MNYKTVLALPLLTLAFAAQANAAPGTVNVISKAKIKAVLEAVSNDVNAELKAIQHVSGNRYTATIQDKNCKRVERYLVVGKTSPNGPVKFIARYEDLESLDCK
jgi:hypothetical protein